MRVQMETTDWKTEALPEVSAVAERTQKMTQVQEIKQEYDKGLLTYDEMAYSIQTIQANCKHMSTTIFKTKDSYESYCDACGIEVEDDE